MKNIKHAVAAVVEAITPKPSLEELTERLRTAKAELAEARKITPNEPGAYYTGLPDPGMVAASIDCCKRAIKVRDAELAFRQGDSESDEIHADLAETFRAKADEARERVAAVKAAQDALDAFRETLNADVEKAAEKLSTLNARRRAEDLPGARALPRDPNHSGRNLQSLLGDLELEKAAELLRQPVPGRDPAECDTLRIRINEIKRGDTERETKRALAAKPYWEDHDEWVAKWLSKDRDGRNEMEARGRELRAKASGYR